jgi:hypothetical protein
MAQATSGKRTCRQRQSALLHAVAVALGPHGAQPGVAPDELRDRGRGHRRPNRQHALISHRVHRHAERRGAGLQATLQECEHGRIIGIAVNGPCYIETAAALLNPSGNYRLCVFRQL